jgi:hypothetical protein
MAAPAGSSRMPHSTARTSSRRSASSGPTQKPCEAIWRSVAASTSSVSRRAALRPCQVSLKTKPTSAWPSSTACAAFRWLPAIWNVQSSIGTFRSCSSVRPRKCTISLSVAEATRSGRVAGRPSPRRATSSVSSNTPTGRATGMKPRSCTYFSALNGLA